jgi:hypothetical protein
MFAILLEGVLFVAGIAAMVTLLSYFVVNHTSLGLRLRQHDNRKRIERAAELRCPIHGEHSPTRMVRLPNGVVVCPECFQETVDDQSQ